MCIAHVFLVKSVNHRIVHNTNIRSTFCYSYGIYVMTQFLSANKKTVIMLGKFFRRVIKRDSNVFYSTTSAYQEKKVKVGKYNINYIKVGHGEHKVLCMPGALGSIWTDFKPQIEGFDREKFSLIIWDPPGYGKSRPPEREFDIDDYFGQDVEPAFEFMKALNIPKFSLMGWSYGGATSLIFAARHPDVVTKLVAWGISSDILPQEIEVYKQIKDVATWSEKQRTPMIELYGEERFSKLWIGVVDAMTAICNEKAGVTGICQHLKDISCPSLILYGEKDPLIDKSHVSVLRKNIQKSRIHIYPEGKHHIHIQYAADFNQKVQEFLLEN